MTYMNEDICGLTSACLPLSHAALKQLIEGSETLNLGFI